MKTDVQIAREFTSRPITEIADAIHVNPADLLPYGKDIAKVSLEALQRPRGIAAPAKLILVSAITPTPAGEGKTTTSIGLAQAFTQLNESVCLALREPSLGPCMGVKGGACGGGYSQVMPLDKINLHFTGDFHAITAANNLLAAMVDNHLHFGNLLGLDVRKIVWRRVMDMNDRALRNIVSGMGGTGMGVPREGGFDITAASEIMAILCLSSDMDDLRARIERIIVGYDMNNQPVFAKQMDCVGAMMALLRDAMNPNLVQSFEGTPAFIHGGPFANIAHGCNSVVATKMAMHFSEWAITEAGFGADLGAEKFFDIKCRSANLDPQAVVLVATVRALKMHGGVAKSDLAGENVTAVVDGLANLEKHIENIQTLGKPPIVALNKFATDSDAEIAAVRDKCAALNVEFAVSSHHADGGKGAIDLAKAVMAAVERGSEPFTPSYALTDSPENKIRKVATKIYGADDISLAPKAKRELKKIVDLGYGDLPICIAKVPGSLSDDGSKVGRPTGFTLKVRDVQINAGAGFIVVITGAIFRMPGLPRDPMASHMQLEKNGEITGLE
ncbi:MAG: formate--tetrahydrofolate ligase [Myxococcota bacterium]|jgi:formate--tetrahydrofolate ligase